ncbi:hypothetical protein [Micromonospora carbonacea]|nr:hypothetical protein [Micromonospora carbonacea]MBB5830055.1 hypothetical protein [Micromonospora carbonacea]
MRTSARRHGRAAHGFASYLDARDDRPGPPATVEPERTPCGG